MPKKKAAHEQTDEERGYSREVGVDGWPVDPRHPANRLSEEEWRSRFFVGNMRRFQIGIRAGIPEALSDAMEFCRKWKIVPPHWLVNGVHALVAGEIPKRGPGRGSRESDMVDFERWDAVVLCREFRDQEGMPKTWDETYEFVSKQLRGRPAQGSPDAIKRAYQRVQRRSMMQPGRYYQSSFRGNKSG